MIKVDFKKEAENIRKLIIKIRRELHEIPEIGFELNKTQKKVISYLEEWGIPYETMADTGICAWINKDLEKEKCIALRCDMDALPIEEDSGVEFKSKHKGCMHACGHDGHTAVLLGATKILNEHKDELGGCVKLIFEPAEETVGGSRVMIQEGVLNNVQAVVGLHVDEECEVGKIRVNYGAAMAASNPFKITVKGKGGHGARPHGTVDPIVITSNIIITLQDIVSRETSPTEPCVISIGKISGGTTANVIPGTVEFEGIIRTLSNEHREYVKNRVKEVAEGIAKTMRGEAEVEIFESYPCLINNDDMVQLLIGCANDIIGQDNVLIKQHPNMGVESFAYFANEKPSVFYFLGSRNEEKGIIHPAHNCKFDIDESCLELGVAIQCRAAYEFLKE